MDQTNQKVFENRPPPPKCRYSDSKDKKKTKQECIVNAEPTFYSNGTHPPPPTAVHKCSLCIQKLLVRRRIRRRRRRKR